MISIKSNQKIILTMVKTSGLNQSAKIAEHFTCISEMSSILLSALYERRFI